MYNNSKDTTFYLILPNVNHASWVTTVWGDLTPYATIHQKNSVKTPWLQKLKKIHFSNSANKKVWVPFKRIWNSTFPIKLSDLDPQKRNYIIFHSGVKFSPSYIRMLKRDYNVCIVYYLPDTLAGLNVAHNEAEWKRYKEYYQIDHVFSFDPEDCKRYGLEFFDIYSKMEHAEEPVVNDLFYIGSCRTKSRLELVQGVFDRIGKKAKCDFRMIGVAEEDKKSADGISYNQPLGYPDVIKETLKSRCILEIINPGQHGNTLRYKEAVCYNKKLLSNNPDILTSKYYNPKWMQYFEKPEDIDVDWLINGDMPDYRYEWEYSPVNLLKMIVEADIKRS